MTRNGEGQRIVINTFGSFGDIHPYIAIALELKARGHHPVVATGALYRDKMVAAGLELHPIRPDFAPPEENREMIAKAMHPLTGPTYILKELVLPYLRESYEDLSEAVRGADLLLTHPLSFMGPSVAQTSGVRWISSVLAPASFLSVYDPPVAPGMEWLTKVFALGTGATRLIFGLAKNLTRRMVKPLDELRAELGLPRGGNPIFEGQHSPRLVLALFSSLIGAPQKDWPPHVRVTGFPFYDRWDKPGEENGMPPRLLEFLDAGTPPIVFTLGSSAVWVAEDFYRESIRAARALGRRAVLLIGDERNRPPDDGDDVAAFNYAPYSELFPRAAAVVHQGGIGTTAQGLRAGKPTLVVAYAHDQPDNGARVTRLGTARTLPRRAYNAARATAELSALLNNPSYAATADEVGRRIRSENGARAAADAIEEVLSQDS
ncbi:MAG TPA: nucleotide disphospho-sugar-binding domain-containing protein [Pyrinomonadaceae bacterium]|jgi:UDP:flavonoid glycosyltransferase YjiC (YdhE family)